MKRRLDGMDAAPAAAASGSGSSAAAPAPPGALPLTSSFPTSGINFLNGKPLTPRYASILEGRKKLPVWGFLAELQELMRNNPVIVVEGETGSGKTTQVRARCARALGGVPAGRRAACRLVAAVAPDSLPAPLCVPRAPLSSRCRADPAVPGRGRILHGRRRRVAHGGVHAAAARGRHVGGGARGRRDGRAAGCVWESRRRPRRVTRRLYLRAATLPFPPFLAPPQARRSATPSASRTCRARARSSST